MTKSLFHAFMFSLFLCCNTHVNDWKTYQIKSINNYSMCIDLPLVIDSTKEIFHNDYSSSTIYLRSNYKFDLDGKQSRLQAVSCLDIDDTMNRNSKDAYLNLIYRELYQKHTHNNRYSSRVRCINSKKLYYMTNGGGSLFMAGNLGKYGYFEISIDNVADSNKLNRIINSIRIN